jgi:hypothetical protein
LICALAAGCSDAEPAHPDGDTRDASAASDAGTDGADASGSSTRVASFVGSFQVAIADADPESGREPYTGVLGVVYDRRPPADGVVFAVDHEQDDCQLLVPAVPFCDPGCGVDAVCTADDECTPYAIGQDLGPVDVEGLQPSVFTMDAIAPAYKYQPPGDVHFPYPPCAEGDAIRVTAQREDMHIESRCVAPLVLGGDPIVVKAGHAVPLTWTPPAQADRSRVEIELDVAHHGGAKGKIRCDVPDTGAFEIPEALVTDLVELGLAGFPLITVTRSATAGSDVAAGVQLTISSSTSRLVDTGVISCGDDLACPKGLSCQTDRTCQ